MADRCRARYRRAPAPRGRSKIATPSGSSAVTRKYLSSQGAQSAWNVHFAGWQGTYGRGERCGDSVLRCFE